MANSDHNYGTRTASICNNSRSTSLSSDVLDISKITRPLFGFCQLLQNAIAVNEESLHIGTQEDSIHKLAKNSQWRLKLETINHMCAQRMLEKLMIVLHAFECACNHDVLKMLRAAERSYSNCKPLYESQVPGFPSHLVIQANESSGHTGDCPLAGSFRRVLMSVDAPREIEHPLSWGRNQS